MSIDGIARKTAAAGTADADAVLRARAEEAAEKFEGFFISQMLQQMRRSARELRGDDGLFQDRAGQDMLEMADQMTSDALAGQHAFGIADMILRQILPPAAPAVAASAAPANKKADEI